jgi:hypothetical protein
MDEVLAIFFENTAELIFRLLLLESGGGRRRTPQGAGLKLNPPERLKVMLLEVNKGTRGMPWHLPATKDAISSDMLR